MVKRLFPLGLILSLLLSSQVSASLAIEEDIYPMGDAYVVTDVDVFTSEGEILGTLHKGDIVTVNYQKQDYGELPNGGMFKLGAVSRETPINLSLSYDGIEAENYLGYTNEILSMLPENMIDALSESGCGVTITDYDIGKDGYYNEGTETPDWSAVTVTWSDGHSNIYVEAGKRSIQQSMIHEIGHSVDYLLGEVSETEEFKNIYYDELKVMASAYYRGSEKEYFAEAFSYYYNFPEKRNLMPLTFEFIDDLVSEYK